eukprot:928314_1
MQAERAKTQSFANARFPKILMRLLHDSSSEDEHIISWDQNGKYFCIRDARALTTTLLPQYFNEQMTFSKFLRKLKCWGFSERRTPNHSAFPSLFYHKNFQRNNHDLCAQITRIQVPMPRMHYAKSVVAQQQIHHQRRMQKTTTKVPFRLTSSANGRYNPYAHIADLHRNLRMLYGDDDDCQDDDSSESGITQETTPSMPPNKEIWRRK